MACGLWPVHLRCSSNADGRAIADWIRRTRVDGDAWSRWMLPVGEESESYCCGLNQQRLCCPRRSEWSAPLTFMEWQSSRRTLCKKAVHRLKSSKVSATYRRRSFLPLRSSPDCETGRMSSLICIMRRARLYCVPLDEAQRVLRHI